MNTDEKTLTHGIRGTDRNAADSVIKDNRFGPEPSETSSRSEGIEAMTTGVQMAGADNVEISGNEFVDIWGGSVIVSGDVQDFNASNNDFMYSNGGVQFIANSDSFSGSLTVKENSFVELGDEDLSTSGGVFVGTSFGSPSGDPLSSDNVVDATNNYWGDASGPSGDGSGDGASVTTGVDFRPWYLSEESVGQGTYDVTFSLTDSDGEFKAFSPHQAYENMEVVTGDSDQVLSYRSADWQPVDPSTGTAADAFFVKNVDAVGYDEADSEQVSVTLPEDSWTFVGSYPNNNNQEVSDVFSMVSGSDEVQTVHHPGLNLGLVDRNDVDAATQTNNVASDTNFGFSSASGSETSVLDGYWMRSSTETTLSTTPQPPVAE